MIGFIAGLVVGGAALLIWRVVDRLPDVVIVDWESGDE